MSGNFSRTGQGLGPLLDKLEQLRNKAVYVGIPAETNVAVEGEFNLASLAAVLEFGNDRIPERPFLRQTLAENQQKYAQFFAEGVASGQDPLMIYEQLALMAQGDVQRNIKEGNWTPNAKSTIKRKGSSKPLIDTGRLRQSILGVVK